MSIKKIILPSKEVRWEVYQRSQGRSSKQIKRRFERKVDAQVFLDSLNYRKRELLNPQLVKAQFDIESTTFNLEADHWLEKKSGEFTSGYFRVINPGLNRIRKVYGQYPISKFTPGLLFEFRLGLKKDGLSQSTQNRYVDLITRIINFSVFQKRISFNPTQGYEKARESNVEMLFWDEGEVNSFLAFANSKYPRGHENRWIYVAYLLALETGVRARELWGLKLSDFPDTGTKLKVRRQASGAEVFTPTKGKDSRYVPYSYGLREEVEYLLNNELGQALPDSTLFVSKVGTAIDHDNFAERIYRKDLELSGLRKIRFHDLRHTALTLMVKRGVLLPIVQKVAGHKDIKTTMRYVHVIGKDIDDMGAFQGLNVRESPGRLLKLV